MTQIIIHLVVLILRVIYAIFWSIVNLVNPKKPKSVTDEIVLITGGGHGIGKELALLYASEGATVVVLDVIKENGAQTVKEIEAMKYPKAYFFLCDVSKLDDVLTVAEEVKQKVGNVTILINNAGILIAHPLLEHTKDEIERIINVNMKAHFWTLQAFLPPMKNRNRGHVVSISSSAGLMGFPNLVSYSCTKFAVRGLMEALSEEFRQDKRNQVQFTSIYPYMVDTGMVKYPRINRLMPLLNTKRVAKEIMNAQRRNVREITIPRHLFFFINIYKLLPLKARLYITDFLSVGIGSDLS